MAASLKDRLAKALMDGRLVSPEGLAKASGMLVDTIRPADLPKTPSAKRGAPSEPSASDPAMIPIEILGRAGYHDVGRLLERLESSTKQVFLLEKLTIEADRKTPTLHRVRCVVHVHRAVTLL